MSEEKATLLMPQNEELILSSSPHIQISESVSSIMFKVFIALMPAVIAAIYFFGLDALKVIILTSVFCVGAEALWCVIAKKNVKETIKDCSALLTGLLLAMNLSANTPWWVCLIGAFLAIWLGKQIFGGLGYNPFNPALVARVGLLIALPGILTTWVPTNEMTKAETESCKVLNYTTSDYFNAESKEKIASGKELDSITCATPLGVAKELANANKEVDNIIHTGNGIARSNVFKNVDNCKSNFNYFLGNMGGCLGETSALALLIGGVLLLFWKLINWRIPAFFIGTVFVTTGIINFFYPSLTPSPIFHVVTGGLMLGAFFMATDMVTSPMTNSGAVVFAIGCGLITSVIRIWGNYPEGVSFSILFMNALVPFIDKFFTRKVFGSIEARQMKEVVK